MQLVTSMWQLLRGLDGPAWTALATVVMAIATIVYTIVSVGLLRATKKNAEIARRAFQLANRPYMGVVKALIGNDPTGKVLEINFVYKNLGRAPANGLRTDGGILVDGKPLAINKLPCELALAPGLEKIYRLVSTDAEYTYITTSKTEVHPYLSFHYRGITDEEYNFHEEYKLDLVKSVLTIVTSEAT